MIRNFKVALIVLLVSLLLFFFRWTIADNCAEFLATLSNFVEGPRDTKTYEDKDLGFSVNYGGIGEPHKTYSGSVAFGEANFVNVYREAREGRTGLVLYVFSKQMESDRNASTLLPLFSRFVLGGNGFVFRSVDGYPALTVSGERVAGCGGRGATTYFFVGDRVYHISTVCFVSSKLPILTLAGERRILNSFLRSFKVIEAP